MSTILSPLRYPGGKNKTYNYVKHLTEVNNINTYIEPFVGGAGVALRLLINNDVKRIVINDYDRSIYAFWYTVINHSDWLINKIIQTDITMDEWYIQREYQKNKDELDLPTLGFSTLFLNRTNRSGIIKAGVIGGVNQDGNYKMDCRFNKNTIINRIKIIAEHADNIELYNLDAIDFIEKVIVNKRYSLTFFDPPYYDKGPELYTNFYNHDDHVNLFKTINTYMRNRDWILTYDVSNEINNIYSNYKRLTYYLNYSVSKPTVGQEYIFFSKKINSGNIHEHLRIKEDV